MSDFYKMSEMMKDLFPSNPEADKQALRAMAGQPQESVAPTKDYVQESVEVPQGSMPLGLDSVSDFAALAGVRIDEKHKTGSAGQLKAKDAIKTKSKPGGNETPHPARGKLVGEAEEDRITALERRIEALEAMLSERSLTKGEENKREKYVKGMKKNKSDFKDRYGKDAEAVMYATATKMAKKESTHSSIKDRLLAELNKRK